MMRVAGGSEISRAVSMEENDELVDVDAFAAFAASAASAACGVSVA